ncbi:MAG TPA: transglycosylase domain-containing protein, partial [Aggregatilineales bacterium]|nr:transglycosylase domain-containing protein [Aggregatilineales bacterium]
LPQVEQVAVAPVDEIPAEPTVEEVPPPAPQGGLFDYIARLTPENVGEFDAARSGALPGIQPDLGEFDAARSGALPGIGAQAAESAFDDSLSGSLDSISQPDLGEFDAARSGALPGLQADTSAFDASRSGQIPGIGAASDTPAEAQAGDVQGATGVMSGTEVQKVVQEDPFAKVENQVTALRQQYESGQITHDQLQSKLRELMILDDAGRWWMLGLESNRWYRFDGRDWIADDPPRPQIASAVPTETGMQEVVAADGAYQRQGFSFEDDSPLPQRVPIEDLGATLVNQKAINLEEHRSFEAPTQPGLQVAGDEFSPDATLPSASLQAGEAGYGEFDSSFPLEGGIEDFPGQPGAQKQAPIGPKMIGIHPDYSEAYGGAWDRASLSKWGLRVAVFGGIGTLVVIFLVVMGMLAFYLSIVNKYSQTIENLGAEAASFETTIIYDGEGNVLAEFNDPRGGARKSVPLNEISPFLIHATISTEDESYYENPGFSIFGIVRATVRNLQTGGGGGGASTITQQLARALVLDTAFASQRSAQRKIEEIIVAAEIARRYDKNQILEFYLNEIYYGNQAYGIEAAAQVYFNKTALDLNPGEAALLAGLPQAPAVYDPVVNRQTAILRMDDVLRLMTEANGTGCLQMQHEPYNTQSFCVTQADLEESYVVQIAEVKIKTFTPPTFEARYPHFVNYVWQRLEDSYGAQRIYSSGFRVYTTIVPRVQDTAQQAVADEIPVTPRANNGSVVALRVRDGAILAMVGSANFYDESIGGQVNVAFTPQQPGSSIKPLVYLTAFEGLGGDDYWYPGTIAWDVPSCWGNYCPRNFSGSFLGPVSVRYALGQSLNIPAIKALAFI